jgi:hypothetical protein
LFLAAGDDFNPSRRGTYIGHRVGLSRPASLSSPVGLIIGAPASAGLVTGGVTEALPPLPNPPVFVALGVPPLPLPEGDGAPASCVCGAPVLPL